MPHGLCNPNSRVCGEGTVATCLINSSLAWPKIKLATIALNIVNDLSGALPSELSSPFQYYWGGWGVGGGVYQVKTSQTSLIGTSQITNSL